MIFNFRRLIETKDLLKEFVVRDLRSRYAGSTMGLFWSVVHPIMTLIIYTFLFSVILKVKLGDQSGITNFSLYLFCGMIPWAAFQETVMRSTTSIVDHSNLIKNLVFPAKILPFYIACSSLITGLISVTILLVAILIILNFVSPYILLLPVVLLFQIMFALGLSFTTAALHVFFRDTMQIVGVFLTVWMFLTPIFYPQSLVPEKFMFVYLLNPMTHLVHIYRDIFLKAQMFSIWNFIYFSLFSLVVYTVGYSVFTKYHRKFVDQL
ncbi:MAG: ABC transporter permease [Nitrospinota bacterium]|nr:ABC transporter permease [Nitrospinota bacterium]